MPVLVWPWLLAVPMLAFLSSGEAVAGPPEKVPGRMVIDETPRLRAEVVRLERAAAHPLGEGERDIAEAELAEARARLATAEGSPDTAATEWRKATTLREKHLRWALKHVCLTSGSYAALLGPLAEARCNLAEVEGRPSDLARELRTVVSCHLARLGALDDLRRCGALAPQEAAQEERAIRKDLRRAQSRLDAVTKKLATG
jgi:hypothetical protein